MFNRDSFDPSDWNEFNRVAEEILSAMVQYMADVDKRKLWSLPPPEVLRLLKIDQNQKPLGVEQTFELIKQAVLPYSIACTNPRFTGWAQGAGNPVSMLADFIATAMNEPVDGFPGGAHYVEKESIDWLKEKMRFSKDSSGVFVSGASMANLIGIHVARSAIAPNINQTGALGFGKPLTLYCSDMTHFSVNKALVVLGLGTQSLRTVPTNANFEMDVAELEKALDRDQAAGMVPFCIVANAGTTGCGSVDDLKAIAAICQKRKIWMHVDGAIGAAAALSPRARSLVEGLDLADSVAFDLHKWLNINYEIGCVLVKSRDDHRSAFSYDSTYLRRQSNDIDDWLSYGVQTTRSFRALKFWMAIKAYGSEKFGQMIERTLDLSQLLSDRLMKDRDFQIMAPRKLSIVCFRYVGELGPDHPDLDKLNQFIMADLKARGTFIISYETLRGKYSLRTCIMNHRMTEAHIEELIAQVKQSAANFKMNAAA